MAHSLENHVSFTCHERPPVLRDHQVQWSLYSVLNFVICLAVFTKSCLFCLTWKTTRFERPPGSAVALYRFHCTYVVLFLIWSLKPIKVVNIWILLFSVVSPVLLMSWQWKEPKHQQQCYGQVCLVCNPTPGSLWASLIGQSPSVDSQCPGCLGQVVVTSRLPCAIVGSPRRHECVPFVNIASLRSRSIKRRQWKHKLDYYGVIFCSSSYRVWD